MIERFSLECPKQFAVALDSHSLPAAVQEISPRSCPESSSRGETKTIHERAAEIEPRLRLASKRSRHFLLLTCNGTNINLDSYLHSFSSASRQMHAFTLSFWLAYKFSV